MALGPTQACYRAICDGVELRFRVNRDSSWLVINRPGTESRYFDIPSEQVAAVAVWFPSEGDSPERFRAFVKTIEDRFSAAPA